MRKWEMSEELAYEWFKSTIDANAVLCGKENSYVGDIYSPLYNSYIEVKDITNKARCGQFTESVIARNPHAQAIYNGDYSPETCKEFIRYHYNNKGISHFVVINNNIISFHTLEEFLNSYIFEVQQPYAKRSGTSKAPKKDIPILLSMDKEFILKEDGYVYCTNEERYGDYFTMITPFDYFISAKNHGELRKRATTKNLTWHLVIR